MPKTRSKKSIYDSGLSDTDDESQSTNKTSIVNTISTAENSDNEIDSSLVLYAATRLHLDREVKIINVSRIKNFNSNRKEFPYYAYISTGKDDNEEITYEPGVIYNVSCNANELTNNTKRYTIKRQRRSDILNHLAQEELENNQLAQLDPDPKCTQGQSVRATKAKKVKKNKPQPQCIEDVLKSAQNKAAGMQNLIFEELQTTKNIESKLQEKDDLIAKLQEELKLQKLMNSVIEVSEPSKNLEAEGTQKRSAVQEDSQSAIQFSEDNYTPKSCRKSKPAKKLFPSFSNPSQSQHIPKGTPKVVDIQSKIPIGTEQNSSCIDEVHVQPNKQKQIILATLESTNDGQKSATTEMHYSDSHLDQYNPDLPKNTKLSLRESNRKGANSGVDITFGTHAAYNSKRNVSSERTNVRDNYDSYGSTFYPAFKTNSSLENSNFRTSCSSLPSAFSVRGHRNYGNSAPSSRPVFNTTSSLANDNLRSSCLSLPSAFSVRGHENYGNSGASSHHSFKTTPSLEDANFQSSCSSLPSTSTVRGHRPFKKNKNASIDDIAQSSKLQMKHSHKSLKRPAPSLGNEKKKAKNEVKSQEKKEKSKYKRKTKACLYDSDDWELSDSEDAKKKKPRLSKWQSYEKNEKTGLLEPKDMFHLHFGVSVPYGAWKRALKQNTSSYFLRHLATPHVWSLEEFCRKAVQVQKTTSTDDREPFEPKKFEALKRGFAQYLAQKGIINPNPNSLQEQKRARREIDKFGRKLGIILNQARGKREDKEGSDIDGDEGKDGMDGDLGEDAMDGYEDEDYMGEEEEEDRYEEEDIDYPPFIPTLRDERAANQPWRLPFRQPELYQELYEDDD